MNLVGRHRNFVDVVRQHKHPRNRDESDGRTALRDALQFSY